MDIIISPWNFIALKCICCLLLSGLFHFNLSKWTTLYQKFNIHIISFMTCLLASFSLYYEFSIAATSICLFVLMILFCVLVLYTLKIDVFPLVVSLLIASIFGGFVGFDAFGFASILLFGVILYRFSNFVINKYQLSLPIQHLKIECDHIHTLDNFWELMADFKVDIIAKKIEKDDYISCELAYRSTHLAHHVILKYLFNHEEISVVTT